MARRFNLIKGAARVASVGISQGRRISLGIHTHPELELNVVRRGRARYLVGDRRYDLGPRSLLWLFPQQEHTLLDYSDDFSMWVLLFRPGLVAGLDAAIDERGTLAADDPPGDFCRVVTSAVARDLERRLQECLAQHDDLDLSNAGLAFVLPWCWRAFREAAGLLPGEVVHPAVERAAGILRRESLSLEELAARVALTPSHLSRLFKRQCGTSITAFRAQSCLERFFAIYGDGQRRTTLDAALAAGFGSYPQCHRVCLELTGRSPRQAALARVH